MKFFRIYKKYIKNILINPAAIFIIFGLSIIPSFYTWITLKANWNPYVDTGNVPVAVVNDDRGTIVNNGIVNFGDEIVNQLQTNTSMKWIFVGDKVANEGLKSGQYYAVIKIPEDFSADLKTISTGAPIKPDVIYRVNEKTNAIAAKISDLAADQLQQQIKETFIKSVNLSLMKQANNIGSNLKKNEPMLLNLKGVLNSTSTNINQIENNINNTSGNLNSLTDYLETLKHNLSSVTNEISSLKNIVGSSASLIRSTKNNVNNVGNDVNNNIANINSTNSQLQGYIDSLKNVNNTVNNKKQNDAIIDNTIQTNNQISKLINSNKNLLNGLSGLDKTGTLKDLANKLGSITNLISNENTRLTTLKNLIDSGASKEAIDNELNSISNLNQNFNTNLNNFNTGFTTNGINTINNLSTNLENSLDNVNTILATSEAMVPQLKAIDNLGISTGNLTAEKTKELSQKLTAFQSTIKDLQDKTGKLNSEGLNQIINILEKNPNEIATFLSSPVTIQVKELYGMSIFGIGLAPFYTVLSIWVGALLCTSLLNVNDEEEEDGTKKTLLTIHFSKMLLFFTINFIQATIVTLGDIYLIGVKPENFWLLLFFAWLSSITFTAIVFTLVSLTGNIGKATALVVMVVQVAGSGAIYPIQVNPEIFQRLEFLWPFTYAIDGFRQAIGGPDWSQTIFDIKIMILFLVIFLLMGTSKTFIHKITRTMEKLFRESGL